jgi:hypothetical protein
MSVSQKAAAQAVQALLGITAKDVKGGKSTFTSALASAPAAAAGKNAAQTAAGLPGIPVVAKGSGSGGPLASVTGYLKPALAGIGVLLLLFVVRRSLRRRQALLGASEARWMPALAAPPLPVEDIALPSAPSPLEIEAAQKKALQSRVEDLAASRPADVASQLRGWLGEAD